MAHKKQRGSRQKRTVNWPIIVAAIGVLLIAGSLLVYMSGSNTVEASTEYHPDDVAHVQPFVAIHEMGEGPPIPFLPKDQPQPKIQIPQKSHDFGVIGPQDVVSQEFIIRNVGEAPLTISRAYTSCGCTTAEISASVIQPGQVATIKLIFDAGYHDTAGQTVRRGLIIENNDPTQSQAEIWTQAKVRSN
jgi:hypothetical protein